MKALSGNPFFLPLAAFLAAVLLYLLLPGRLIRTEGIWINDEGNRMLQIEALAQCRGAVRDPLAGREETVPGLAAYSPDGFFIRDPRSGCILSAYSPVFASVCVPFWKAGGFPAVRVLILFFALLAVFLLGAAVWTASRDAGECAAAVLLGALGTPLLFYSGMIAEQSMAAALTAASLLLTAQAFRRNELVLWAGAGILLGFVPWFREEAYFLAGGMTAGLLLCRIGWRKPLIFAGSFFAASVPLWMVNFNRWGSIFGIHHIVYKDLAGAAPDLLTRCKSFLFFLFRSNTPSAAATALALLFAGAAVFGFIRDDTPLRRRVKGLIVLMLALGGLANLYFLLTWQDPMASAMEYQSVCGTVPFAVIPLVFFRMLWNDENRFYRASLIAYALSVPAIALLLEFQNRGIFFGPRHFLLPLGLGAVLTARIFLRYGREEAKNRNLLAAGLFVLCLCAAASQVYGMKLLYAKKAWTQEIIRTCETLPCSLFVTDTFYMPEELAALPETKKTVYLTGDPRGAESLTEYADSIGADRFYLFSSPRFSSSGEAVFSRLAREWTISPVRRFEDPALRFMTVHLFRFDRNGGKDPADAAGK